MLSRVGLGAASVASIGRVAEVEDVSIAGSFAFGGLAGRRRAFAGILARLRLFGRGGPPEGLRLGIAGAGRNIDSRLTVRAPALGLSELHGSLVVAHLGSVLVETLNVLMVLLVAQTQLLALAGSLDSVLAALPLDALGLRAGAGTGRPLLAQVGGVELHGAGRLVGGVQRLRLRLLLGGGSGPSVEQRGLGLHVLDLVV